MRRILQRVRLHGGPDSGQAMLEYALITGTVIAGFAVALQLGLSQVWVDHIDQPRDTYFVTLHFNCPSGIADCAGGIGDSISTLNHQIATR